MINNLHQERCGGYQHPTDPVGQMYVICFGLSPQLNDIYHISYAPRFRINGRLWSIFARRLNDIAIWLSSSYPNAYK